MSESGDAPSTSRHTGQAPVVRASPIARLNFSNVHRSSAQKRSTHPDASVARPLSRRLSPHSCHLDENGRRAEFPPGRWRSRYVSARLRRPPRLLLNHSRDGAEQKDQWDTKGLS